MADVAIKDKTVAVLALDDKVLFSDTSDSGATKNAIGVPVLTTAQTTAGGVNVPAMTSNGTILLADGLAYRKQLVSASVPTVGALGDSIVSNGYAPEAARSSPLGYVRQGTGFGAWVQWACFYAGSVAWVDLYAQEGFSGDRTDEVLAAALGPSATNQWGVASTIPVGTRARLPKIVFEMSGTNDAYLAQASAITDGTALAKAVAGRRALWAYLRGCGSVPIALSMLPMQGNTAGVGGGLTGAQLAPYMPAWNTAMKAAADADGVAWVDGYTACAATSGGGWKTGYIYHNGADDPLGIHPSLLASLAIGQAAAPVLAGVIASAPSLPRIYQGDSPIYSASFVSSDPRQFFANFSNPLFSSTTGWSVRFDPNADASLSIVTPSQDANGGTLRLRKPSNAGSRYTDWIGPSVSVTAGQEYLVVVDVRFSSFDSMSALQFGIVDNTSGNTSRYQTMADVLISGQEAPLNTAWDTGVGRLAMYYKIPTGITSVAPMAFINRTSGGTAGGFDDIYISNLCNLRLS